jgi:ribulose-phosphate 3-epimerase
MEIIPAILPKNFKEIEEKVELLIDNSEVVQIDICDGKFVPTTTWPYWKADENFESILREERGMPNWENINYEFDLMIQNPTADDARKWLSAGAERIVLHHASSTDLNPVIAILSGLVEIGIAINNNANIEEIKKYSDKIQFIQIMGIRKAGFQGQRFESDTVEKAKEVKLLFPNLKIQVDGGVSIENAPLLKHVGVDILIVGSAIFGRDNSIEDVVDNIQEFKQI